MLLCSDILSCFSFQHLGSSSGCGKSCFPRAKLFEVVFPLSSYSLRDSSSMSHLLLAALHSLARCIFLGASGGASLFLAHQSQR